MWMCLFSSASTVMPTSSPTTATSCLIPTYGLWYRRRFSYTVIYKTEKPCSRAWQIYCSSLRTEQSDQVVENLVCCFCVCQYKEGKKLKPKPNYNSVDLSEVEWEDTEEKVSSADWHLRPSQFSVFSLLYVIVSVWCLCFQLRTAMVKGETGGMSLDVRTSVDKGVSTFALIVCQNNKRSCPNYYIRDSGFFVLFLPLGFYCLFLCIIHVLCPCFPSSKTCLLLFSRCSRRLSQTRVMFLKNDYSYTVINETPFRFVWPFQPNRITWRVSL